MELIYETISRNPGYFAWAFSLVNVAWGVFLYFNRKQHDKDLGFIAGIARRFVKTQTDPGKQTDFRVGDFFYGLVEPY